MALVRHIYGRAITFRYIPIAESEEYVADSLVSARLYGPNAYPSDAQILNTGTGEVSEVLTWALVNEEGTGPAEYKIVFPAIVDATPTNRTDYDVFFVAINYVAEASGATVHDVEQIFVYRPDGLTSKIRVSAQDVYRIESKIEEMAESDIWTEGKIEAAVEELLSRLEGRGYAKRRLFNLEKLNGAAAKLACSYACLDLYSGGDISWKEKANFYREQADSWFEIAKVGIDTAGNDQPDAEQKVASGAVIWMK